jgi:hypothetical protein
MKAGHRDGDVAVHAEDVLDDSAEIAVVGSNRHSTANVDGTGGPPA